MNTDFYIHNTNSRFIEIAGEDKAIFLQALITNDIFKCDENQEPIYSCILTPQGKFLADFFIINFNNHYLIEIHDKFFESFLTKLNIYKLRSKVTFKKNIEFSSYILFSKNTPAFKNDTIYFNDPRNTNLGLKIYSKNEIFKQEFFKNIIKSSDLIYSEILMKNLVPNSHNDLIENKSLLLENNFQNINAINWDKGCYIGQELTARMKYRALLKKQIYVLELKSGDIIVGTDIFEEEINIGSVVSRAGKYVLCMLKINKVDTKFKNKEIFNVGTSCILKFL